jgi:hypothetical protein
MIGDLTSAITGAIAKADQRIIIISAFVKYEALSTIMPVLSASSVIDRRLYLRWQKGDLVEGASDLTVFELARAHDFTVFLYSQLHAKVYAIDSTIFVGSANLTAAGFGLRGSKNNFEFMTGISADKCFEKWLNHLHSRSTQLSDRLYMLISKEIAESPKGKSQQCTGWSAEIRQALNRHSNHRDVSLYDFPWLTHPDRLCDYTDSADHVAAEHDLSLYEVQRGVAKNELAEKFIESIAWQWLVVEAASPTRFGTLSERLHAQISSHPNPFRKDVKIALQNLLSWAQELVPQLCVVARSNRSQLVHVIPHKNTERL